MPRKNTAKETARKAATNDNIPDIFGSPEVIDFGKGRTLQLPERHNLMGGMTIQPVLTQGKGHPYDAVEWERRDVRIMDFKKGKPSYERLAVEVPKHWADNAVKITVSKYLFGREPNTPEFEDSLRHAFDRIAYTYTCWGWRHGYFATTEDAKVYAMELQHMLVHQMWAPNSPVWFNIGHWEQWRWGRPDLRDLLGGRGNKAYTANLPEGYQPTAEESAEDTGNALVVHEIDNVYTHPQASACFLLGVDDSMEAILKHQLAEGGVFSSGSGVGVNISSIRSSVEPIAGKGTASGPISFDKGWDRMAGAIKSGGKTRRAARMVLMYGDHPDVFRFLQVKNDQEEIGKILLREHNVHIELIKLAKEKRVTGSPAERMAAEFVLTLPTVNERQYDNGMDDLLYGETLGHQNANHSISLKGEFWKAYNSKGEYSTRWVTDPSKTHETFKAEKLLDAIAESVYHNAEPGSHNNDFINIWNPVKSDGSISTSNPCSEYLHLNFTSCNLSSFNVYQFLDLETRTMRIAEFQHGIRLAMIAADLNVEEGGFPVPEIAKGTYLYRTTGIGYANLGGMLMAMGIPYDSDEGRLIASQVTSLLTSTCWQASAEMGHELGAYARYDATRKDLFEVLTLHKVLQELANIVGRGDMEAAEKAVDTLYRKYKDKLPEAQGLTGRDVLAGYLHSIRAANITAHPIVSQLCEVNQATWNNLLGAKRLRNSFVSCIAPTGTISAPMGIYDRGTTSAEPDYTLVKYKNLSGGGMIKLFNVLALEGLLSQGYSEHKVKEAAFEVAGLDGLYMACNASVEAVANHLQQEMREAELGPIRKTFNALMGNDLRDTPQLCERIIELRAKGQDNTAAGNEITVLNGDGHMENIPWIAQEHLAAFDCSATSNSGTRAIAARGHMKMLGAVQPFVSGAISKTVNLPASATIEEIKQCFVDCHDMGVKCVALFRADSKGISVYNVDTPEGQKWNPQMIWDRLLENTRKQVDQIVAEASKPRRIKLPGRRMSQTVKFSVGGRQLDGFLTVGVYPDGTCGEVFGRVGQGGSFASGMFENYCKVFSTALQYGVPLHDLIESFRYTAFDPSGFSQVGDTEGYAPDIKTCKSVVDLMMQILGWLFPEENGSRIIDLDGRATEMPTREGDTLEVAPVVQPPAPVVKKRANKSAESCPKCGSLAYVHDGKCRSCRDCGFKDGGCGE